MYVSVKRSDQNRFLVVLYDDNDRAKNVYCVSDPSNIDWVAREIRIITGTERGKIREYLSNLLDFPQPLSL